MIIEFEIRIKNVNLDGNVLIVMELDKNIKDLKLQCGITINGNH